MKMNTFKYSVLTAGIVAAMSVTSVANSATPTGGTSGTFDVENKATATYTVAGNSTQQNAESNKVTVNVSETGSFSLIATVADSTPNDNFNHDTINPQASSTVDFTHKLTNNGNVSDTYTVNVVNATDDDFDYSLPSTTITYQKKDAGGVNIGSPMTITNGSTINLAPNQYADITIKALTTVERINNKTGALTVTATSAYLKGKNTGTPAAYSASNIDHATTATPLYAITKSAETNLGNKTFDTNNANAYVDYTITIKNEGTAIGTAVNIIDTLPTGLIAIQSTAPNYKAPTVVATGDSAPKNAVISTNGKEVTVTAQDIKINETITVTFRAKKDTTTPATGTNITNYAVVKDSTKDNGTFDLVDSSGDAADKSVSEKTYEDTTATNYKGKDSNSNATITTSSQTRNLTIKSNTLDKEVALISQNNTYIYTITNKGTDIVEAASVGKVYFTVAPTTNDANITINEAEVFVDANDNGSYDSGETLLTKTANGYDLNEAATTGLAPDDFVKIGVKVNTNGSGSNLAGGTNNIDDSETMAITVLPQGPVAGTPAPANASVSSTTTMKGVNLLKYQAVAACKADLTTLSWTNDSISGGEAKPGNCVYYKITAENTFTDATKVISGLAVTDTLETPKIIYEGDFTSETSGSSLAAKATYSNSDLVATFDSLAASEIGTIYFSAKISQTGTN